MRTVTRISPACLVLIAISALADEPAFTAQMAEEHAGDRPVATAATEGAADAGVDTRELVYGQADGDALRGYLATPDGEVTDRPGVLVIHEWWGLNDNIRKMTRKLAAEGYAALAVDLYGGEVADEPDAAMKLVRSVDEARAEANLRQAHQWLTEHGATTTASIGWCFGGGWSLRTALLLPESLDAAVIYYGRPVTDHDRLAALQMPVLGHFGAEDDSIPPKDARAFEAALSKAGVAHNIHIYDDAGHAFANPSGQRYVEAAAAKAWERTRDFLAEHLQG